MVTLLFLIKIRLSFRLTFI